jgi:hypothetical protein
MRTNRPVFGGISVAIPFAAILSIIVLMALVNVFGFGYGHVGWLVAALFYICSTAGIAVAIAGIVRHEHHRWLSILGVALNLGLLGLRFDPPGGPSVVHVRQGNSIYNLEALSQAALAYKNKHAGASPQHLADLLLDEQCLLENFYIAKPNAQRPNGWQTDRELLENYADYVLPLTPDPKVLIFERPELWPDGSVAVGFSDGSAKRLSASEFKALGVEWRTPSAK